MQSIWKACRTAAVLFLSFPNVALAQAGPDRAVRPAPVRRAPAIVSPELGADRRVTFRLRAPDARAVTLNGEWAGGTNVAMTKDASGIWSVVTAPIAPEAYFYT